MMARGPLTVLVAFSLLAPAFLAGAQATNDTDDGSDEWVDCWEDGHAAGCDAFAATVDRAYELLEQAEEDGRMSFSLDDEGVQCDEEEFEDEASVHCYKEDDSTSQEDGDTNSTGDGTYEADSTYEDDAHYGVECWEDEHGTGCDAIAATVPEAYDLLEEAEADGRMPFSLDDEHVTCHEEEHEEDASVYCYEEQTGSESWVECWDDQRGTTCDAFADTREKARAALEDARGDGQVSFELDDPYTECHAEEDPDGVRLMCTHVDRLVECWEDEEAEGPVCEAWGETVEDARAKLDREADELPFDVDDPDVRCEEETREDEAHVFCFQVPEHEPRGEHREGAPEGEPDCQPRPEEGIVVCAPPPACEGQLGQTPECTPPSECEIVDPDTVECPMEAASGAGGGGPAPDCDPHPSQRDAMVCRPPAECEGQLGDTPACTPPPECQPQGDGTFLCKPGGQHPEEGPAPREDEAADAKQEATEELDRDLEDAVHQALAGFREELDALRTEYEDGKAKLADRYEGTKDELRADYGACLDELDDDADRAEELEKELACKEKARQALTEEREVLLAERDLLREDLLSKAETKQFHTCQNLEETLHGILMDHGIFESDLSAYLSPSDLGLCAGILLDAEVDGADIGDWGAGGEAP